MRHVMNSDMDYTAPKDLARRLKRYRLDRKWTLQKMADLTGITLQAIWRLENGLVRPHERTFVALRENLPGLLDKTNGTAA